MGDKLAVPKQDPRLTKTTRTSRIVPGLVLRLAVADLRHESLLSLCLVLALAAVIAPMLLLFGLKYGTIETLRQRLVRDPAKREIGLRSTAPHSRGWLAKLSQRPEVGFLVPMTRQIANDVTVTTPGSPGNCRLALLPTAAGDPLLIDNGVSEPKNEEAVLTALAADDLGVTVGGVIEVRVEATRENQIVRQNIRLKVSGVLPSRASNLRALYTQLSLLEAVESFKDGIAVPDYGWAGGESVVPSAYDGVIVLSAEALTKEMEIRLQTNTGLGTIHQLASQEMESRVGWKVPKDVFAYLLENASSTIGSDSIAAVRERLRGLPADVTPWVRPINIVLKQGNLSHPISLQLATRPLTDEMAAKWKVFPPFSLTPIQSEDNPIVLVPASIPASDELVILQLSEGASASLNFKVRLSPAALAENSPVLAPVSFASLLRRAKERTVRLAEDGRTLILERAGYSAFRLYAKTIDDVEPLRRHLESEGLTVTTESQRISEVNELDRQLTRVFSLVAFVGIAGGLAALVASLCGSVERKRRELGILRLMGLPRARLMRFPLSQGLMLVSTGFFVALAAFYSISVIVDQLFSEHLAMGESFCRLPSTGIALTFGGALACAAAASTFAGIRAMRSEPADVLREE